MSDVCATRCIAVGMLLDAVDGAVLMFVCLVLVVVGAICSRCI